MNPAIFCFAVHVSLNRTLSTFCAKIHTVIIIWPVGTMNIGLIAHQLKLPFTQWPLFGKNIVMLCAK